MAHTIQEKSEAVSKYREGVPVLEICSEFGICKRTIYRWEKEFGKSESNQSTISLKEYKALQRKNEKHEKIISILKSVSCTVHAPLKERLSELEKLYSQYDVHTLCDALDVPRGTFYNHIFRGKKDNAWYIRRREEYRAIIQEVFDEYNQILGPDKIRTVLVQRGHKVSVRFVAALMDEMGLDSIRSTAKRDYQRLREPARKENILNQQFHTDRPNQVWTSDITYFRVGERHFYICVILDLFSRRVIAHKISRKNSTQLVSSTLKQAIAERGVKAGLIFHSDRGTQYTSHSFCALLKSYSIVQSFSNTGKPHDNAVTETFFSTLKREELYRKDYPSEKKFKQAVDTYMTFYNTKRPHKTLKNLTPYQAEERFYTCQKDTQH